MPEDGGIEGRVVLIFGPIMQGVIIIKTQIYY